MSDKSDEIFASTAPYYARYRSDYADELYEYLRERFGLDDRQRVLDLGTGTGLLALPLSRLVAEVIAVEPERGLLDEARTIAAGQDIDNIDWRFGDPTTLPDMDIGRVRLAVIGAAFHRMDQDRVLRDLDRIVEDGGAVVLAGSADAPDSAEPPAWNQAIAEVRTRYLGETRGAGPRSHLEEGHREVLARSPFSDVEVKTWDRVITRNLDEIVGLQFSYPDSSPERLGSDKDAFESDLRAALNAAEPSGVFAELVRTEAIIGSRP